jgi:hypothetical protein
MMRAWKVMRFLHRRMHREPVQSEEFQPNMVAEEVGRVSVIDGDVENLRTYYMKQKHPHNQLKQTDATIRRNLKLVVSKDKSEDGKSKLAPSGSGASQRH